MKPNSQTKPEKFRISEIPAFFKSKLFGHTVLRLFLVFIILWILHSVFLRLYTHHGQKVKMPRYIGVSQEEASRHAMKRDFKLFVTDSVFWKGKPGGLIMSQIPLPGSMVKEGRSIYVTITKYRAEGILSADLPTLYGKRFELKRKELFNNFELFSRVKEIRYDPGPEQHILEVFYKGQVITDAEERNDDVEILKGDTLDFVLSTQSGGKVEMPKLLCMNLAEARFLLSTYKLELSDLQYESEITDEENAFVIWQNPGAGESIALGSEIQIKIRQEKPADCN